MNLQQAINFIKPAITPTNGLWADIGAGTGTFTLALDQILDKDSTIYATDKNPHGLWRLEMSNCKLIIEEHDFNNDFNLPMMDGIVLANALHYSDNPKGTIENILKILKPGGTFILIEYEKKEPLIPWIPYPIPFGNFEKLAEQCDLCKPEIIAKIPSSYGHEHIYLASARKV